MMAATLEEKLDILPVQEAIDKFETAYPRSDWNKLQIEPEGPFIKYEMVGNDGEYKNTLEINAHTGDVLKEKQKPLKETAGTDGRSTCGGTAGGRTGDRGVRSAERNGGRDCC